MSGRKKDLVWMNFKEVRDLNRKGTRAQCKQCGYELEGQVYRMKNHLEKCQRKDEEQEREVPTSNMPNKKCKSNMDNFIVTTTTEKKDGLDLQLARYIYATNSAFRSVEHPQFIKLIDELRPGYKSPSRKDIGNSLLDTIYNEEKNKCISALENKVVCLGIDGWSNIHNEPILGITVTTAAGHTYLIDTVDTSENAHTAEYMAELTYEKIKKYQEEDHFFVKSVVTDNAANVSKMRLLLENNKNIDVITYGCSAHVLNLLANDCEFPNLKEHVLSVVKYFRNKHFANALYRKSGAPKLTMPAETRWNSLLDCFESYINGWPLLIKICEDNFEKIDQNIHKKVCNVLLKRNIQDMITILKPISETLDIVQKNLCSIGHAVYLWKKLKIKIWEATNDSKIRKKFMVRYNMALTPAHFLCHMLEPNNLLVDDTLQLDDGEKKMGFEFANLKYGSTSFMPLLLKFQAQTPPFQEFLFKENVLKNVSAYEWWKSQEKSIENSFPGVFVIIEQLLLAQASTASVERAFSSFGLVHSKLRNRLGIEKASKLVFLFKVFNS